MDNVLAGLHAGTMATALIARLEHSSRAAQHGPPHTPLVIIWAPAPRGAQPSGDVELLSSRPERLLGADPTGTRADHEHLLHPDDTVIFYTDGLIEHGRTGIDEGLDRLTATLRQLTATPLHELCDQLLDRIVTGRTDDDIALLAVRCDPQQGH